MLTRVFTLRFNGLLDAFDDAPLCDFIKDKEVIAVRDHFFLRQDQPYLVVIVNYTLKPIPTEAATARPANQKTKQKDESWREYVAEADVPLFNALRDWRMARSKREGLPPYVICTNRHLAAMIAARPQTLAQLGEIEGFGKAKLERYGADILAVLARARDEEPAQVAAQSTNNEQTEE
jgi:superfamily II DNA helicase RecQ